MSASPTDPALFDVLARHRYRELDGLRGIAAMMVVLGHGIITVFAAPALSTFALFAAATTGIINGGIAVDLFFIMSGFFLARMIESARKRGLATYYKRRLARLAPPAIVSVIVLYIYTRLCLGPTPEGGALAAVPYTDFQVLNYHMNWHTLALQLILIRNTLNPVLWTIRLEIFISILYPAVMFLHWVRHGMAYRAGLMVGFIAAAILMNAHQKLGLDVFHYLYMFYAGTLLREAGPAVTRLPAWLPCWIATAGILIMAVTGEAVPLLNTHPLRFDLPVTLGGAMLIAMLAHAALPRARAFLSAAPVQFLGRISYSLYLIHWLAVRWLGQAMLASHLAVQIGVATCVMLLVPAAAGLSVLFAMALHAVAERPATSWSRRLGVAP